MADLADAGEGTILDPAAGTGELLAAALDRGARRVAGQELDPALARLAETRLLMATSQGRAEIRAGDSLLQDAYDGLQADVVLCHPPFASRDWHPGELAGDARWEYGIPPKSESELAWAQHALAHLRPGGRAVLLMPPAVASRPSGRRIRAGLLRDGAIRAIVSLPPGTIRPSHIPHPCVGTGTSRRCRAGRSPSSTRRYRGAAQDGRYRTRALAGCLAAGPRYRSGCLAFIQHGRCGQHERQGPARVVAGRARHRPAGRDRGPDSSSARRHRSDREISVCRPPMRSVASRPGALRARRTGWLDARRRLAAAHSPGGLADGDRGGSGTQRNAESLPGAAGRPRRTRT